MTTNPSIDLNKAKKVLEEIKLRYKPPKTHRGKIEVLEVK
jgi:hypothetical protein